MNVALRKAVIGQFWYRGEHFDVAIWEGEARSFVVQCPVCGQLRRLNESRHVVTWNMGTGKISVTPNILCPEPRCGWKVAMRDGIAIDCADEKPTETHEDARRGACLRGSRRYQEFGKRGRG